jgi:hypothetical protein
MEAKEFGFSERDVYDRVILLLFLRIVHKDQNCEKSEKKLIRSNCFCFSSQLSFHELHTIHAFVAYSLHRRLFAYVTCNTTMNTSLLISLLSTMLLLFEMPNPNYGKS